MAETKTPAQREAEADLGKRELTPAEKKRREDSHKDAPPVPEMGPAIGTVNAAYNSGFPNWSDPPELAEGEVELEGSVAQPLREDWEKEAKKVREEEKKHVAKMREENDKRYEERRKWDEKEAKRRREAGA